MQKIYLRIALAKIAWFKFILEGYDGLCVLSTVDHNRGIVSITYHASVAGELFALLTSLSPDLSPYWSQDDEERKKTTSPNVKHEQCLLTGTGNKING